MTIDEYNEYLSLFPENLQCALENCSNAKQQFMESTYISFKEIKVYRAIMRPDKLTEEDFLSYPTMKKWTEKDIKKRCEKNILRIESFGISVNTSKEEMIKSLDFPSERLKGIAEGIMTPKYGTADFKQKDTHHNWYLFQDQITNVQHSFSIVEDENEQQVVFKKCRRNM